MTEERKQFTIDGKEPREILFPETVDQVAEALRLANEQQRAVAPIGLGAFLHLGALPRKYDVALSLQQLQKIVDYQPTDMTVTVEPGLPLAQLQRTLGEQGQWLPIDPPLPERATIGGILAANLNGPTRLSQGTIRDSLIGLKAVRVDGTVIKGGGRVVKNVAGYDIPKLFCGSFGTLGVIVEATFKILPRPEVQTLLACSFLSAEQAMEAVFRVTGSELQPFFIELANFAPTDIVPDTLPYRLFIGFAGIVEEVQYQEQRLRELLGGEDSTAISYDNEQQQLLFQTLCDFPVEGTGILHCKTSLLPTNVALFCKEVEAETAGRGLTVRFLAHAGNGIVFSHFAEQKTIPPEKLLSFIDWLRVLAKKLGGYVIIERIDSGLKTRVDVWGHVDGTLPLMKKLKETFDPNGILNPGRFVGGI